MLNLNRVNQDAFHSMRGHVRDGMEVVCQGGEVVTIKSSMRGWEVRRQDGSLVEEVGFDAMAVPRVVMNC